MAATMLGWDNLFHCEINPFGRAVLDYWYPNAKSYEDITTTDFSEWRGRVTVLTGGFPCQPFSYAGQRRGAQDDRYLWPYMFRCIDQVQPDWVVAENVAGITTMVEQGKVSPMAHQASLFDEDNGVQRYRLRETFTLERICQDLESHGYEVQPVLIPACAVGAPHRRDRVFIVARRVVADTDNRADRRGAGQDEGKGGEERIQERHEVRKPDEPNQVRPKSAAIPENTLHGGQLHGQDEEQGSERNIGNACTGSSERICGEAQRPSPSHTPCRGEGTPGQGCGSESHGSGPYQQPGQWGAASEWSDRFYAILRNVANACNEGPQGNINKGKQASPGIDGRGRFSAPGGSVQNGEGRLAADTSNTRLQEEGVKLEAAGSWRYALRDGERVEELRTSEGVCGSRWANFPTVSPVHSGNDGIPIRMDGASLSFGKWRTEALKAYGNAIVPQVMYEIFRAIEMTYQ